MLLLLHADCIYLVEAPDSGQDDTILEFLHIIAVSLYHSRVPGSIINPIIIRVQLDHALREVLQLDGSLGFGTSSNR